jgi:hypothetical protein
MGKLVCIFFPLDAAWEMFAGAAAPGTDMARKMDWRGSTAEKIGAGSIPVLKIRSDAAADGVVMPY